LINKKGRAAYQKLKRKGHKNTPRRGLKKVVNSFGRLSPETSAALKQMAFLALNVSNSVAGLKIGGSLPAGPRLRRAKPRNFFSYV
jgi:hypothetical protein